ncbi:MAG: YggS family pyridoxal phosphate-dependent enzyme [Actinobacteria bacterium]|nr:YggS family pyridoxal phosphate-dependent enzyme [Actinomycetota bacterium]
MSLAQRYEDVKRAVEKACVRVGRNPGEVVLVAVSKTVDSAAVHEAILAGAGDFGENRSEELLTKAAAFPDKTWHFIGNIQSRKIKDIVGTADLIHSVDRTSLFDPMQRRAAELGIKQRILLEVNVSGEETKSGFAPDEVRYALQVVSNCENLVVCGLMTMAPQGALSRARETFRGLRELRDILMEEFGDTMDLQELSMGMSEDFETAIEEGATIVRVGRSIFSEENADIYRR